jgi:hypothetical protein
MVCLLCRKATLFLSWCMFLIYISLHHEQDIGLASLLLSQTKCIDLVGDSNTKCTHLGGGHPMVWLWDYQCFKLMLCSPLVIRSGVVLHSKRMPFHSQCDISSLK